jgi:hypothetical protein
MCAPKCWIWNCQRRKASPKFKKSSVANIAKQVVDVGIINVGKTQETVGFYGRIKESLHITLMVAGIGANQSHQRREDGSLYRQETISVKSEEKRRKKSGNTETKDVLVSDEQTNQTKEAYGRSR